MKNINNILQKITQSSVIAEPAFIDNYFIARTGVNIKLPYRDSLTFIGGFSCKKSMNEAIRIAQFEAAERILATYYFSDINFRDAKYELFSALTHEVIGLIPAKLVLVGPTILHPENDTDAVGLGFHLDKYIAIEHALFEFIERHLLAKIWYEKFPLVKIDEKQEMNYHLINYTINLANQIPFVMTIILGSNYEFLCVGASVSSTLLAAKEKAQSEAVMLANDVIKNKNLSGISNPFSRSRMLSQKIKSFSMKRKKYLDHITYQSKIINNCKSYSVSQLLKSLSLNESDIGYCLLHSDQCGYLARGISQKLKTLKQYREDNLGSSAYLLDPVC